MGRKRKTEPIRHDEIVRRFAARLREVRHSRGMTQAALAEAASVTPTYIGRLENGGAAPGIDLVARLAAALGVEVIGLMPTTDPPDPADVLREQARRLFEALIPGADRETLQLLVPFLARLSDTVGLNR
ncbi:helix-turn-helix domain-containing protein [Gemmata sp. JC717]|uniref:helix-turn-helix domain-containing protein n=1 Tax=Gemmata algarum TaxID=2975278 RepID=UPI0021BAE8FC|nr:helix-turn-helix domain-containing protein [Gemmata algarum]MDY3554237.1 helix-turn-helix domain-containing protein [Gemmata algarum]